MDYPDFSSLETKFSVKDYTVSGEEFELKYWSKYDMLVTFPQPFESELGSYYESEDYISHTDSKQSLVDKVYQRVKNIMLKRKLKLLSNYQSEKGNLLDIGAGTGDFLKSAQDSGWTISGIEPNEKARSLANQKGVSIQKDLEMLPKNHFDAITMWHVLEHVPNLFEQIELLKSLLKDSGTLLIAVPNHKSHDAEHYGKFWAGYDVPRHLWHFSPKGITSLFSEFGFKKINQHPMTFDSYYVSLLSEQYRNSSFQKFKAFYRGFISNFKAKSNGNYSSLIYTFKKDNPSK